MGNEVVGPTGVVGRMPGPDGQADAAYIAAVSPHRLLPLLEELWRLRCSAHREPGVPRPLLSEAD